MGDSGQRAELRAAGREARRSIEGSERAVAESALIAHLHSLIALDAPTVGVFLAHDGEPDLSPLIATLWANGQTVALPVLQDDATDFSMRFVPWHEGAALRAGRYGIPVPPPAEAIEPATLLVSLTGFDANGNRMGRGAGFFDRYLATFSSQVIGVGFEVQRFELVPTEPHDVALPVIVTDLGVRFLA